MNVLPPDWPRLNRPIATWDHFWGAHSVMVWYHFIMSEDFTNDGDDEFTEDPRIADLVGRATSTMEIVLNAEFLLDEWVTTMLQTIPETYRIARKSGMTPEQKYLLALGYTAALEDSEYGGQETFTFLHELYRIRTKAGRVTDDKLLSELASAYVRTGGSEALETYQESQDAFSTIREMVAARLSFAQAFLSAVLYSDDDDGDEE